MIYYEILSDNIYITKLSLILHVYQNFNYNIELHNSKANSEFLENLKKADLDN